LDTLTAAPRICAALAFGTEFATLSDMPDTSSEIEETAETEEAAGSTYDNNLRRWFHLITISIFSLVYGLSALAWETVLPVLGTVAVVGISLDLIRVNVSFLNRLVQNSFSFILRKHEFHSLSGTSWFLLAAVLSIAIFPKIVSSIGFLYLALGDPSASYFGIKYGKKKIGQKTWTGSFAFFIICWFAGTVWLWIALATFKIAVIVAGISSLLTAIAEREVSEIDDNLVIPLVASGLIALLLIIIG